MIKLNILLKERSCFGT